MRRRETDEKRNRWTGAAACGSVPFVALGGLVAQRQLQTCGGGDSVHLQFLVFGSRTVVVSRNPNQSAADAFPVTGASGELPTIDEAAL